MIFLILVILFFFFFIALTAFILKRIKKNSTSIEIIIGTIYILSLALFSVGMFFHNHPYYESIDPVDGECYSPFASRHFITLVFYFLAFNISLLLVWIKNTSLPPLALVLSQIFIIIGIIINVGILYQISVHDTSSFDIYYDTNNERLFFLFAPVLSSIIGIVLCYRIIKQETNETFNRTYSNKYLNALNKFLEARSRNPIWILIFLFPILILVTLLLILFGQDTDSIVKVFTDTTTWRLSQQMHPPVLDHKGHYLCTVAASGHPKIVKPLRIGQRNGNHIIVNRQLLIANAFEEMIQDSSPKLHRVIRNNYDKYGYNISTKINTTQLSNITYIVMKPLEWLFVICLYLFCYKPEQKIKKQYAY